MTVANAHRFFKDMWCFRHKLVTRTRRLSTSVTSRPLSRGRWASGHSPERLHFGSISGNSHGHNNKSTISIHFLYRYFFIILFLEVFPIQHVEFQFCCFLATSSQDWSPGPYGHGGNWFEEWIRWCHGLDLELLTG